MSESVSPSTHAYTAPAPVVVVRRYKPGFGLRLVRSLSGLLLLALGVILVASAHAALFLSADPALMFAEPWPLIGAALLILGWVVVAGPILGRLVAAVLALAAAAVFLLWPFVAFGGFVSGPENSEAGIAVSGAVLIPLAFAVALAAWLTGRGRSPLSYLLLVLPIATHLVLHALYSQNGLWYENLDVSWLASALPWAASSILYGIVVLAAVLVTTVPAALIAGAVPAFQGRYNTPEPTPDAVEAE